MMPFSIRDLVLCFLSHDIDTAVMVGRMILKVMGEIRMAISSRGAAMIGHRCRMFFELCEKIDPRHDLE